jgi:hypothetical protein
MIPFYSLNARKKIPHLLPGFDIWEKIEPVCNLASPGR